MFKHFPGFPIYLTQKKSGNKEKCFTHLNNIYSSTKEFLRKCIWSESNQLELLTKVISLVIYKKGM